MTEEQWICENCGHDVTYDSCGFIFIMGQVRSCEKCREKEDNEPELLDIV